MQSKKADELALSAFCFMRRWLVHLAVECHRPLQVCAWTTTVQHLRSKHNFPAAYPVERPVPEVRR